MYLLDTDTCIYLLNQRDPEIGKKFKDLSRHEVAVSTITMAELHYGAVHSKKRAANQKRVDVFCSALTVFPFSEEAARIFGATKQTLMDLGEMIGVMDLLIASAALAQKAVLVTHNTGEFQRVPGLKVEDWFQGPSLD